LSIASTDDLKALAAGLVLHAHSDLGTVSDAIRRVAKELGLRRETLRTWVRNPECSGAKKPAQPIDLDAENKRLCVEPAETKRADDILTKAASFFAP